MEDLFGFWARCKGDQFVHPDDADVLGSTAHSFNLECLPSPFTGPLRTAPVVLLFIAPGFDPYDLDHAKQPQAQAWYERQRGGDEPLSTAAEHRTHYGWWTRIVRQFGITPEAARAEVAVLDMAPYHSKSFHDWPLLAALPSARKAVDWAQSVLFPAARAGDRIVVCLRSAAYWGLASGSAGRVFGEALFCPAFTRGGFMRHGPMREQVRAAVQKRVAA
ncbi:hypothetical protein H8M03_02940 [Sphingomonas sabuli]|uniref:Uncharacterized protein n=1 Tax=Sphingomonas sabuli TaxID=2764186 RepID=A0A7G9L3W9_9SPHN|nr:hypothetical protein [Sphingomonas sabuli]QNM83318.1 hypothetical protein H8M03_02940 [Sphingomonas sabuli]